MKDGFKEESKYALLRDDLSESQVYPSHQFGLRFSMSSNLPDAPMPLMGVDFDSDMITRPREHKKKKPSAFLKPYVEMTSIPMDDNPIVKFQYPRYKILRTPNRPSKQNGEGESSHLTSGEINTSGLLHPSGGFYRPAYRGQSTSEEQTNHGDALSEHPTSTPGLRYPQYGFDKPRYRGQSTGQEQTNHGGGSSLLSKPNINNSNNRYPQGGFNRPGYRDQSTGQEHGGGSSLLRKPIINNSNNRYPQGGFTRPGYRDQPTGQEHTNHGGENHSLEEPEINNSNLRHPTGDFYRPGYRDQPAHEEQTNQGGIPQDELASHHEDDSDDYADYDLGNDDFEDDIHQSFFDGKKQAEFFFDITGDDLFDDEWVSEDNPRGSQLKPPRRHKSSSEKDERGEGSLGSDFKDDIDIIFENLRKKRPELSFIPERASAIQGSGGNPCPKGSSPDNFSGSHSFGRFQPNILCDPDVRRPDYPDSIQEVKEMQDVFYGANHHRRPFRPHVG